MTWVSGLWPSCDQCHGALVVTHEHYDAIDKVVVGTQRCRACGQNHLYSRRPTTPELAAGLAHLHPLHPKGPTVMRLFDLDKIGVYLDGVTLRLEKTKDSEHKVIDLTLRVQPFTAELAAALHPEVRALLFTLNSATPKPLIKSIGLALPDIPKQHFDCFLLPEDTQAGAFTFMHAEISEPRARTEKGVDGYALVFYATIGPVGKDELEYVTTWYAQQRFVTFREAQGTLALEAEAADERSRNDDGHARHLKRRGKNKDAHPGPMAGESLRDGVRAEH
jgi:hypothetical protein